MSVPYRFLRSLAPSLFTFFALLLVCTGPSLAQSAPSASPAQEVKPAGMGTSNTGEAHAAVLDSEHRPITAGGFVKTGPILYQDIAKKAGLTSWTHVMGTPAKDFIIETAQRMEEDDD